MTEAFRNLIILYCLDAPEWARYAAVDGDGELYIYVEKPNLMEYNDDGDVVDMWYCTSLADDTRYIKLMNLTNIDWKLTLVELT